MVFGDLALLDSLVGGGEQACLFHVVDRQQEQPAPTIIVLTKRAGQRELSTANRAMLAKCPANIAARALPFGSGVGPVRRITSTY